MNRLKLILVVATIMATLLAMNAGPVLADDGCIGPRGDNGNCIGVEEDRNHHGFFINDFYDFYDFYDDFDDLDCEFVGWDGDEAIYVCELDF